MICPVCGNDLQGTNGNCPYCGATIEELSDQKTKAYRHKTINLEAGRPVTEVALHRCRVAILQGQTEAVSVMTLIHGYGSSGKGGAIREECRKMLEYMKAKGVIRDYIPGEEYCKRSAKTRTILQRYPKLLKDPNLNRGNQGITLVIMC